MNSRFFMPIVLAFLTVWGVQWFFGKKTVQEVNSGVVRLSDEQSSAQGGVIKVQKSLNLLKPLNTDIDIPVDGKMGNEHVTRIENDNMIALFSDHGALLKEITFKKHLGKNKKPLKTVYDRGVYNPQEAEKHCFLLALDNGETPYLYRFMGNGVIDNKEVVTYRTETKDWLIDKSFIVYADACKIDVTVKMTSKKADESNVVVPRLFFVAPMVNELVDDSIVPLVLNESGNYLEKLDMPKIADSAWYWNTDKVIFGAENRYFVHALTADSSKFVQRGYFKTVGELTNKTNNMDQSKLIAAILEGPEVVADKETNSWTMSFYVGPKIQSQLTRVDERLQELLSFGWLSWFCTLMLQLLGFLYAKIGNYGLAIIALTVIVRIPFIPLSFFSRRKMEEYQKHQPHITRIRMKYKNDPKLQQAEIIQYHKDHDLSPATPIIGCLPLLIQIPILLSLYRVLWSYLDLYQAPFFGWIVDLSVKDPFYVLPILMGVTMIWQQSMTAVQDEKQRVISWFMGIVMTVLFAGFPAGLVLYWFMNNVLTLIEDYVRKAIVR